MPFICVRLYQPNAALLHLYTGLAQSHGSISRTVVYSSGSGGGDPPRATYFRDSILIELFLVIIMCFILWMLLSQPDKTFLGVETYPKQSYTWWLFFQLSSEYVLNIWSRNLSLNVPISIRNFIEKSSSASPPDCPQEHDNTSASKG